MLYLLAVSLLWAFSFGLIKGSLTNLDSNLVSFIRLFLSFLFFLPVLKLKSISNNIRLKLLLTGSVQYGMMYSAYIYSYQFLLAHEVALFTIFTPIYVTMVNDLLNRKFNGWFFITSILAVIGAVVIYFNKMSIESLTGFILIQVSNICFAFGQIYYKKIMSGASGIRDRDVFALLYLGAIIITGLFTAISIDMKSVTISSDQIYVLIYLGIAASGIGFFLWNYGARRTNAGALSVFNNLKIPLAITVSLIFFGESAEIGTLITGGIIIIGSLLLNQYIVKRNN